MHLGNRRKAEDRLKETELPMPILDEAVALVESPGARIGIDDVETDRLLAGTPRDLHDLVEQGGSDALAARLRCDGDAIHRQHVLGVILFEKGETGHPHYRAEEAEPLAEMAPFRLEQADPVEPVACNADDPSAENGRHRTVVAQVRGEKGDSTFHRAEKGPELLDQRGRIDPRRRELISGAHMGNYVHRLPPSLQPANLAAYPFVLHVREVVRPPPVARKFDTRRDNPLRSGQFRKESGYWRRPVSSPDPDAMPDLAPLLDLLGQSQLARLMASSADARQMAAAGHAAGALVLVGALLPMNLRLLGFWRGTQLADIARVLGQTALLGLVLSVASGLALMSQRPFAIAADPAFQAKGMLIALAGINALLLRLVPAWRLLDQVDSRGTISRFRTAGLVSLTAWAGVLILMRWPELI